MKTRHPRKRPDSARGAALIELAFVLPLLFLILAATYELGRYFSSISWLAQAGYQTTLVGGLQSPGTASTMRMTERYNQMRGLFSAADLVWDHMQPQTDAGQLLVEAELSGMYKFRWLGSFLGDLPLAIRVIGPVLVRPVTNMGSTEAFCNWSTATNTAVDCTA